MNKALEQYIMRRTGVPVESVLEHKREMENGRRRSWRLRKIARHLPRTATGLPRVNENSSQDEVAAAINDCVREIKALLDTEGEAESGYDRISAINAHQTRIQRFLND